MKEQPEVDLSSLSLDQLKALLPEAESRIVKLEESRRQEAWEKMVAAAAEVEMTPAELMKHVAKKEKEKARPKYQNPENPKDTWGGRGRKPEWIESALASGKTLKDLEA